MALVASNVCMGPFQPEPGPAMVEIDRLPVIGFMACLAIGYPFFLELVMVRVFVTGGAVCGQTGKTLMFSP